MAYLIGPGSIGVFMLALYVLARWTASATSYAFLLFPLVAIALGAVLLGEPVQPSFLLGGAVVLVGVYVGAIYRPGSRRGHGPRNSSRHLDEGVEHDDVEVWHGFGEPALPVVVVGDQDLDLGHGRARDDERVRHREVGLRPDPGSLARDVVRHVDQTEVAEMAQEPSAVATAAGPRRNGRTRISATVIAESAAVFRPVATNESNNRVARSVAFSPPARYASTTEVSTRIDRPGAIASASGSPRSVTASRSPARP